MANSILKKDKGANEIFQELEQQIDRCMDKFGPDTFVLCEVPPLKYRLENVSNDKLIDEFNGLLSSKYNDHPSGKFVLIRLNELIPNVPRMNNSVAHYKQTYQDNVHLNYRQGIPYFKKILQQLLKTSNRAANTVI